MTSTTMQADHRAHVAFYLTGNRLEGALHAIDELRPALFGPYSDLTALRYDFPVVLLRKHADTPFVTLSSIIDRVIETLGPSSGDGERVRKLLLRHERAIRTLVATGTTGTLGKLWNLATQSARHDAAAAETLARARAALDCDGQVLDCDSAMPATLFVRAWRFAQDRKTRKVCAELDRLILQLSDILRADFAASNAARTQEQLKASVGRGFEDAFDFDRMSTMLTAARPAAGLSATRRRRIEGVLRVLEAQPFFGAENNSHENSEKPYGFVYASCAGVEEAYRERMPQMVELAKAMAIAALEVKGEYNEAQHDALFDAFGANGLTAEELAQFPDYLLWLYAAPDEHGELMALLAGNVPVKVLLQFDDLLQESRNGDGNLTLSLRSKQLADLAIGLNNVYVLQSAASNVVQMKDRILKGLSYSGPALFSVYSGAQAGTGLSQYLVSAAAMECRAFPAFTYDPSAGSDWASRFSIDGNPQPESDWPVQSFTYESGSHERVAGKVEFTLADFMACDPRYARHYAKVPAANCNGAMLTVREWLAQQSGAHSDRVPTLMMLDHDNVLQRVIVDARAIEEAKRCRAIWHSLQELGGIHNSHAERLLARERAAWEAQRQHEIEALSREPKPTEAPVVAAPAPAAADAGPRPTAAAAVAAPDEKSRDEAYIETPRCTTCEECVQISKKMFAYDANKQAYIADIGAGTYRQLVEAAEACQVSIIHPGKPHNPSEPGLEELLQRAEPFR
ncbi:MAG: hypothetical protein ACXWCS_27550 [Burkholderiales bacterium]